MRQAGAARRHNCNSVADVAERAGIVCVVLPTLASVEEAILGETGIVAHGKRGTVVIQMSTISPTLTERLAREVAARGLRFLDGPVSGTSAMVARGDGLIIAGGDASVLEECRPILEAMLPRVVHVGPAGHATVVKLVANLLVGVHSLAAAEALTMARKAGVDLDTRARCPGLRRRRLAHARRARPDDRGRALPSSDEARSLHEGPASDPGGRARGRSAYSPHGRERASLRRGASKPATARKTCRSW